MKISAAGFHMTKINAAKIYWKIGPPKSLPFGEEWVVSMGDEYLPIGPRSNRFIDILPSMKVSITIRVIDHDESIDILIVFHR